jgi:hypothetical protein
MLAGVEETGGAAGRMTETDANTPTPPVTENCSREGDILLPSANYTTGGC